jgi:hypothetical protein
LIHFFVVKPWTGKLKRKTCIDMQVSLDQLRWVQNEIIQLWWLYLMKGLPSSMPYGFSDPLASSGAPFGFHEDFGATRKCSGLNPH